MFELIRRSLGPLQTNAFILASTATQEAAIVDPAFDGRLLAELADARGWRVTHILLTHTHFDHIGGLAEVKAATGAPIFAHPDGIPMLEAGPRLAAAWGITFPDPPPPDRPLIPGDALIVGDLTLDVLYTPGHAPGHVSFHLAEHQLLFSGDVLFQQSIGRTDLPGGDLPTLMHSIRDELLVLPDETQVLCGHGPTTTIGAERQSNPFLQLGAFR